MTREYDFEEDFHAKDRKHSRKERRRAQETDRSKFKKTDREEKKPEIADENLQRGRVVSITGEGIWVDGENARFRCTLKGLLKKEKMQAKNLIAVGDFVRFTPTAPDEASIAQIEDRYSYLARTDISGRKEQLIAVNVDQAVIASSITHPPLKPALIDRYLIAAEKGNIHPLIVVNKIDLLNDCSPKEKESYLEFLAAYEALGIPILSISTETGIGLDALRALLKNKVSVFSGQSGVGKSSLINACFGLKLRTGGMAHKTSKGTHTTSTAELLPLPEGGYCVDTPGIRSFGIWNLQKDEVTQHFYDLAPFAEHCKFTDCSHSNEPDCAVLCALEEKKIARIRYESYQSLLEEATGGLDNRAKRKLEPEEE
jgi:ribosome biogenesis GTPase